MTVFEKLIQARSSRGGGFLLLLDPDRLPEKDILSLTEAAEESEVDALLVGTSLMLCSNFHAMVKSIKEHTSLPLILFPGAHSQISPHADAVLFTSLISGRNPNYLIDEQVKGAPLVKEFGLEAIPTGYMLIDSGKCTSVQYISNTCPIPSDKTDIACAHALAARYMGMRMLFLEAGSGAERSVPEEMISEVARYAELPVMVGGGITTPDQAGSKILAGASFVVIGNRFENGADIGSLHEFAQAVHHFERIGV